MTTRAKKARSSPWPTAEERHRERESKREAVLRAAVQMFNARGYHATSLDDVAARLGVTKPVIYHYFGNKDQVLFHCVSLGLQQLRAASEHARREPGTGLDRLRFFLRRYAEVIMQDYGTCVIRTGDEELSPESRQRFRALKGEIDAAMRALIQEGVEDGSIIVADVRLAAFTLAGSLNWIARWYDPAGPLAPQDIATTMVETLVAGLAPRTRLNCAP